MAQPSFFRVFHSGSKFSTADPVVPRLRAELDSHPRITRRLACPFCAAGKPGLVCGI